jgi:hypothetical protein
MTRYEILARRLAELHEAKARMRREWPIRHEADQEAFDSAWHEIDIAIGEIEADLQDANRD